MGWRGGGTGPFGIRSGNVPRPGRGRPGRGPGARGRRGWRGCRRRRWCPRRRARPPRPVTRRRPGPTRRAVARSGVPPMLTRATLPSCAAQPTMAQSSPRWANFWNDQPGRGGLRHPDLGEQLVGLQRGLEQALEEPADLDLPLAARPARDQGRVQREQDGGQVGGGIGVRDRAADRAPVPDLRVADPARRVREQWHLAAQQRGMLDVMVPGQRADRDVGAPIGEVGQLRQPGQVDDHLGGGQPQLHQRQQRVSSGQELRVLAVLGDQVQRLLRRACPLVGER